MRDNERPRLTCTDPLDEVTARLLDRLTHVASRGVGRVEARVGCFFETLVCNSMLKSFVIQIEDREMLADLILMDMYVYDIILGMDWLVTYHASVDCFGKEVVFRTPGEPKFRFKGSRIHTLPRVILALQVKHLLRKKIQGYLAHVLETRKEVLKLDDILVVREFPDVFLEDLPGIPVDREIEFSIDVLPGISPILKAPYRMAPTELKELEEQLQELLDKVFIRPSASL